MRIAHYDVKTLADATALVGKTFSGKKNPEITRTVDQATIEGDKIYIGYKANNVGTRGVRATADVALLTFSLWAGAEVTEEAAAA